MYTASPNGENAQNAQIKTVRFVILPEKKKRLAKHRDIPYNLNEKIFKLVQRDRKIANMVGILLRAP